MEQLQNLSLARRIILGGAILLLIDTFLDWQQVSGDTPLGHITVGQNAWHGFWGVVLALMTIALILWVLARMFSVQLPEGVPEALIALALAGLILLFAIIKVISDEAVHWPAYVGIVLAAAILYGAWLNFQESGEALPGRFRTMTAGAGAGRSTAPTAPTPTDRAETEPPASDTTT